GIGQRGEILPVEERDQAAQDQDLQVIAREAQALHEVPDIQRARLAVAHSAATAWPAAARATAESSLRCAPCERSTARTSATSTSRGRTPRLAATAAPTPAAWPVSQHCGISRMKPWLLASQLMCRPAASKPSSARGTRLP